VVIVVAVVVDVDVAVVALVVTIAVVEATMAVAAGEIAGSPVDSCCCGSESAGTCAAAADVEVTTG